MTRCSYMPLSLKSKVTFPWQGKLGSRLLCAVNLWSAEKWWSFFCENTELCTVVACLVPIWKTNRNLGGCSLSSHPNLKYHLGGLYEPFVYLAFKR